MTLEITRDQHGNITYVQSDGHVVITGPVTGIMTLADGTKVNVNDPVVEVDSPEQAAELAHLIGQHWAENGHPHDVEYDDDAGEVVQRPFVYDDAHFKADKATGTKKTGA